jgi:hypothetical protein
MSKEELKARLSFKKQVKKLMRDNERPDIDPSQILKVWDELPKSEEEEITPQHVYDKLIETYPVKKTFPKKKTAIYKE